MEKMKPAEEKKNAFFSGKDVSIYSHSGIL